MGRESPVKPDFIAKKVRVEHLMDEVRIILTCNSGYEAAVLYEDIIERSERGMLSVSFRPKCPSR